MIRPITCITFLFACGSGLYLYHVKHQVRLLDQQIVDVVHQTKKVRAEERVLRAQWALLDEPGRLQKLATQFLTLQPTKPTQYATAADLDSRLPPVAQPPQPTDTAAPAAAPLIAALPPPAAPPAPPEPSSHPRPVAVAAATPRAANAPAVRRPEHQPVRTVADRVRIAHAVHPPPQFAVVRHELPPPRPMPRYARPVVEQAAASRGYVYQPPPPRGYRGGSLLGMAHAAAPPPPQPMPMTNWQNWNP